MLIILAESLPAQLTFERTYGGVQADWGRSVLQTPDGGYVIAGCTESSGAGGFDVHLIKIDSLGDMLWEKTYGGSSDDLGYSVRQTTDGGYIVVGETQSFGAGWEDVYLVKTDAFGDTLWQKTCGGASHDMGYSVEQTLDGGYIVVGASRSFAAGWYSVYLVKTDSLGDILWQTTSGGIDGDYGYSVHRTPDGEYVIGGETESFSVGLSDFWLIKTDFLGGVVWDTTYGGAADDHGYSLQPTLDGGYVFVGQSYSFGADADVYVIRTDSSGNVLWDTTYGSSSFDVGYSVQQTSDGGYVIAGRRESLGAGGDVYLIKTDSSGDVLWERTFGGSSDDVGYSVQQTLDGGYVIAGHTESFGAGGGDIYLIKTDENGVVGLEEKTSRFNVEGSRIELLQNQPNPLHTSTEIHFSLGVVGSVTLEIYNASGRLVRRLVDNETPSNFEFPNSIFWDGRDQTGREVVSGVYFCRLEAGDSGDTKKMILVR
ncbi:MAG: T9SS type A sorting domain-containing protein [bacterium]